jgi:CRP-like cAMP-binding protein
MSAAAHGTVTRQLLDLDLDLASELSPAERLDALSACDVPLIRMRPGRWDPRGELSSDDGVVGLLIVEGLLCLELVLHERSMLELLGSGDIAQHPSRAEWPRLGGAAAISVVETTLLAVLGTGFIRAAAQWPGLFVAVNRRLEDQRHRLAIQGLIGHFPQAEDRVLLQLWHLGTRWGRVTPDGIVVPFKLTHELLGHLIGARRPTVTLAVRELEERGLVWRPVNGWLLTQRAEPAVKALVRAGDGRLIGSTLATRLGSASADEPGRASA